MNRFVAPFRRLWASGGWSMGVFAIGAGVIAAWSMQHYLVNRIADIEASTRVRTVVRLVAAHALVEGDVFSEASVATHAVPLQWAGSDGLAPEHFDAWEGSVLVHGLQAGEQILATNLRAPQPRSLASVLGAGRRAVTISVNEPNAQPGWVRPGDRVDVYVTREFGGSTRTHLLLRAMRVIAVGAGQGDDEEDQVSIDPSGMTLDASSQEAARLVAARQTGTLSAVLRGEQATDQDSLVSLPRELQIALGLMAPPRVTVRKPVPVLYGAEAGGASESTAQVGVDEAAPW